MTKAETQWKRLTVRWRGAKGFSAMVLFLFLALLLEAFLVYSFQTLGLADPSAKGTTFLVPLTNWTLGVSVSPLLHLLPLGVIIVMMCSWAYLTKYTAFVPERPEPSRRVSASTFRREQEARRFRSLRRFTRRISRRLQRVGRAVKSGVQRIRGVSYISQRLYFARATVRSALTVLLIFLSIALLLFVIEYPDVIRVLAVNLHMGSPTFRDFVLGTTQWVQGIGQAVPPLGGLGTALNNAVFGVAPGFRRALQGAGSLTVSVAQLDVTGKYVLSQNLAAWISAVVALAYGAYVSSGSRRRRRVR